MQGWGKGWAGGAAAPGTANSCEGGGALQGDFLPLPIRFREEGGGYLTEVFYRRYQGNLC